MLHDSDPLLIESMESKTTEGGAVYNKIQYRPDDTKDIWLMEQSHLGLKAKKHVWDKIAIVVDKSQKPYKAKFFQYENSDQEISTNLKPIDYKVSCFFCHSNGLRAIRPNGLSKTVKLSLWDQARVLVWNTKI